MKWQAPHWAPLWFRRRFPGVWTQEELDDIHQRAHEGWLKFQRYTDQCCSQVYYCPTTRELECQVHGGLDGHACCEHPELHQPIFEDYELLAEPLDDAIRNYVPPPETP